jgi:hypothetical protein
MPQKAVGETEQYMNLSKNIRPFKRMRCSVPTRRHGFREKITKHVAAGDCWSTNPLE